MRAGHPESRAGLAPVRGWNRVGAEEDLFWPTPPHNLGLPLWPGDRSHHHHHIRIKESMHDIISGCF